jgi:hypothetical protein
MITLILLKNNNKIKQTLTRLNNILQKRYQILKKKQIIQILINYIQISIKKTQIIKNV